MKLLYRIFRQDPDSREGVITVTSAVGIIVNVLIAGLKVVIGTLVSSIAIVSEGINNATDAATSILTIVGTKLSGRRPTKKHPFGFGRIEYLTSLVISLIIIISGIELLAESVHLIFEPAELSISLTTIIIILATAVIKLILGLYTIAKGKQAESGALVAVGVECRNDSLVSAVTIISAVVFLLTDFSIDAYAGIITSLLILKAGLEILKETISELLGRPGKSELAEELYREIRNTPGVLNVADMMLHNYGPDSYSGSVNIEIDHERTVGDVYSIIHDLQLRIMHTHHVTMVFGIYAVDRDHKEIGEIRKNIAGFVKKQEHILSYHALYLDPETDCIYIDFVVDYELKDWKELREQFLSFMKNLYPKNPVELTIETEYV